MEERNINRYDFDSDYAKAHLTLNQYVARTYGWMFVGLMITFALAAVLAYTGTVFYLFSIPSLPIILLIAELAVVLILSAGIQKRPVGVTRMLFALYSLINGMVFSVYGRFTKTDLSRLRPLLIGGLIFLLIAGLLMMFIDFSPLERIVCMVGIVVFLCFTAYDTQKIKANYEYFYGDEAMLQKASIYSALQLYLDFINLFLYLLRFLGRNSRR